MSESLPLLRVFVAMPRSGSTLFMRIMATHPEVQVCSRTVIMGNMDKSRKRGEPSSTPFLPDHRIFCGPGVDGTHPIWEAAIQTGCRMLVSKEELGNDHFNGTVDSNECRFEIFPDADGIIESRPVFVFRHPFKVFDSWLSKGWDNVESFIVCYNHLVYLFNMAIKNCPKSYFYIYEDMVQTNESQFATFDKVCEYWRLENSFKLKFESEFGSDFLYWSDSEKDIYQKDNPKGIFDTVASKDKIVSKVAGHGQIDDTHKRTIEDAGLINTYELLRLLSSKQ